MPIDSVGSRQSSGFAPHAKPPQRFLEILYQRPERSAQRCRPRDDHIVVPVPSMLRHNLSDGHTQAPTRAVALDSATNTPAGGIADTKGIGIPILSTCLKDKSGSHVFPAPGSISQRFGSSGKSADSCAHRVRLRGASGPFCAGWQESAGQPWWPCASESRGAACGQASLVDRYVSRLTLRST